MIKVKLKNGRLSKGKRTKAKQLHALEMNRQENIIKSFKRLRDKSANSRAMYKIAGVTKQRLVKTNESRSINCPVNRFCVATKKESRKNYSVDFETWRIVDKPKEWIRLTRLDLNAYKVVSGFKRL